MGYIEKIANLNCINIHGVQNDSLGIYRESRSVNAILKQPLFTRGSNNWKISTISSTR
jgi:hypothetical protein